MPARRRAPSPGPKVRRRAPPPRDVAAPPVLLVHGVLGQGVLYWNLFRRRLEADGFRVVEASLPYALLGDLRAAAESLQGQVEAALRESGEKRADLVCHSAGGIAARYYVTFLGGAKRVRHLVMLGTPHHGTYSSLLGAAFLPLGRQTRPGSPLLDDLNRTPLPPGVEVTNVWSPVDGVVFPAQNALLPHPSVRNVRLPWTHHWAFLWSRDAYELVREALAQKGNTGHPQARQGGESAEERRGAADAAPAVGAD